MKAGNSLGFTYCRSAMTEAGIREGETWSLKAIEFKTWLHLSSISQVLYVPETFAKYASHPGQSSSRPKDVIPLQVADGEFSFGRVVH